MTEQEWLVCSDPELMLDFLHGKASERKLGLFAAASFRNLAALLPDIRQKYGIEVLEQVAEGTATVDARRDAVKEVRCALPGTRDAAEKPGIGDIYDVGLMLYRALHRFAAGHAVQATAGLTDGAEERVKQSSLLRCIFGNPFRPVQVDLAWLQWHDGAIVHMAQTIYDERRFQDLPILADALEEAGCTDRAILDHCRGPGEHARGCWLVDALLGKE